MKLPLFVYNYTKKRYELFPYHLLTTLSNGKLGIVLNSSPDQHYWEKYECIRRYRHHFQGTFKRNLYAGISEYTLREQK